MKTQYVLNEADIKEAIAAYVARKHGGNVKAANVTLKTSPSYDRMDNVIGQDVSATVTGEA